MSIFTINKSSDPYNGLNAAMRSLEKTGLTKHKIGGVTSTDYVYEEVKHADLVIFGNYLPQEVYEWVQNLPSRVKTGYLFCSPLGQASCNGEIGLLRQLLDMLKEKGRTLNYLFCSDKALAEVFASDKVRWLPVVSDFEGSFVPVPQRSGILLLGNNLRTHRNFVNQLAALKLVKKHHNGSCPSIHSYQMPNDAFEFFKNMFDLDNWVNHTEALTEQDKVRVIAKSQLGLQVTYSDSFNIAAYEHAMCHIQCLTNASLDWVPKWLTINENDSPIVIARHINACLVQDHHVTNEVGGEFRMAAKTEMERRYKICDGVLRGCI
jgi:hypothetical protein